MPENQENPKDESEERRQQNAILAAIEHELRNPLAAISFSLDSLKQTESLSESGVQLLEIALRQTHFAAQVLETLSDVSQLQDQATSLPQAAVDLNEVVTQSVDSVRPALLKKRQRLNVKFAETAVVARGTSVRLQQAITNLLDNASKFTPEEGGIWIETVQTDNEIRVIVRDSGDGIDPAIRGKIFDLFFCGSSSKATEAESSADQKAGVAEPKNGTGIGLFLVQQIASQHGGSVEVATPQAQQGSEFTLRLQK